MGYLGNSHVPEWLSYTLKDPVVRPKKLALLFPDLAGGVAHEELAAIADYCFAAATIKRAKPTFSEALKNLMGMESFIAKQGDQALRSYYDVLRNFSSIALADGMLFTEAINTLDQFSERFPTTNFNTLSFTVESYFI